MLLKIVPSNNSSDSQLADRERGQCEQKQSLEKKNCGRRRRKTLTVSALSECESM